MSIDNSLKQLPTDPWGVIMLCHGSRRGASRDECSCSWAAQNGAWPKVVPPMPQHAGVGLTEASQRLQSALGDSKVDVLLSCLEFIEPHPDKAVEVLAGRGRSEVVFMPYLLGHGKHATEELEEVLDGAKRQTPQVKLKLTSGFGADSRLSDLVVDRVRDPDGTPGLAPLSPNPPMGGVNAGQIGMREPAREKAWAPLDRCDPARVFSSRTGPGERSMEAGNRVIVRSDAAGCTRGRGGREFGGVGAVADSAVRRGVEWLAAGPGRC